jgi:mono/diheme cytochrome c family protein
VRSHAFNVPSGTGGESAREVMERMKFRSLLIVVAAAALFACARNTAQTSSATTSSTRAVLGDGSHGAEVFRANCAVCHTANGAAAGVGPSLEHEKQRKNYDQTVAWIESPNPPMPKLYPSPLSEKDVEDVAAYVQSL